MDPTIPSNFEYRIVGDTFEVNLDPIWEFERDLCIKCTNKNGDVSSKEFTVRLECPSDINVWQPQELAS